MNLRQINVKLLKETAKNMVKTMISVNQEDGSVASYAIFSTISLIKIDDEWFMEINCTDHVIPYIFGLTKNFFSYELGNILKLNQRNYQQLYRLLKQYEKLRKTRFSLVFLKHALGLEGKYEVFADFKRDVLKSCQKALKENTDIKFDFALLRTSRKVIGIEFTIKKNKPKSQLRMIPELIDLDTPATFKNTDTELTEFSFSSAEEEFSEQQIQELKEQITKKAPKITMNKIKAYLEKKYKEMCDRKPKFSRFAYLKKLIEVDDSLCCAKTSYDIDLLDKFWNTVPQFG